MGWPVGNRVINQSIYTKSLYKSCHSSLKHLTSVLKAYTSTVAGGISTQGMMYFLHMEIIFVSSALRNFQEFASQWRLTENHPRVTAQGVKTILNTYLIGNSNWQGI